MKKKYIVSGVTALTILASAAGLTSAALASNAGASTGAKAVFNKLLGQRGVKAPALTAVQRAEMKTKSAAIKTALDAGDYNAWAAAVKALDANSPLLTKITASNFATYAADNKAREAALAVKTTKTDAVKTALDAGDYNAWVVAVKALNANSPILQKITSTNFSRYVEANKLSEQVDSILKDLGVNGLEMGGLGKAGGRGRLGNFGPGSLNGGSLGTNQATGNVNK